MSGDLDQEVRGLVDNRVSQFEMATAEELKQKLEEEKEQSRKMQESVEIQRLQNELDVERLKQQQWATALDKLKEAKEQSEQEHDKCMEQMEHLRHTTDTSNSSTLEWLKAQLESMGNKSHPQGPTPAELENLNREIQEREAAMGELRRQREEIDSKLAELDRQASGRGSRHPEVASDCLSRPLPGEGESTANNLMEQLKAALLGKRTEDPNKTLLKALVTQQNKTTAEGGTNTLKPGVLKGLAVGGSSMADWLANLNKQEEGEFDVNRFSAFLDEEGQGRTGKTRSRILDRATTNIQQKQVWPQQNLGEDWADEDVEFKQMKFEHLVAWETRTIETCTELSEILGRLRLLRRISYLKLRGYEWHLLRKMYAAILTSIETKEYSWESNFDRFKTILYRRVAMDSRTHHSHNEHRPMNRETGGRRRYCRDYNRPEGCPKNSPHPVWTGNGPSAVKRTVYHCMPHQG